MSRPVMLTHAERAERRERIAKFCRKHSRARAAAQFGVSITLVHSACAEHGVPRSTPEQPLRASTWRIIRLLLKPGTTNVQAAKKAGVTPQRVAQIKTKAERNGVVFPRPSRPRKGTA